MRQFVSWKMLILTLLLCFSASFALAGNGETLSFKSASYYWTVITHPVEAGTHQIKGKSTCAELQHCIPQSLGGSDYTTAYWARSNHSVSDRWKGKRFVNKHDNAILSTVTFGNDGSQESLNAAYRMGAYGLPYSVFFHHYNRDSSRPVFMVLDGPSMLLYGVTWLINMPQKLVNQVAYTIEVGSEPNLLYLVDVVVAIFAGIIDFFIGVVFTVIGTVLGFIFHPINSLCSILGMVYFVVPAIWTAIVDLIFGLLRLLPFI